MPISRDTSPGVESVSAPRNTTRPRVVFVAGSGRSGTSTFAGALQHLGLHVPQPEVVADETNPRGFGEPQWVVDFHNRLLKRTRVQVSDARPQAWRETEKLVGAPAVLSELTGWLAEQVATADELVIKDPRLAWFLALWREAAVRCDVTPCFATMLRPPMEVVGSKEKAYGNRGGDTSAIAAWVNMMLHTERATRGSTRVFLRYHDLLENWKASVFRAGEVLDLEHVQKAESEAIARVSTFIDPGLRSVQATWDDFQGPARLRELSRDAWTQLDNLAEPDGDVEKVHTELDRLRDEYATMYADAEAIAKSTSIAAARRAALRATRTAEEGIRADTPGRKEAAPKSVPSVSPQLHPLSDSMERAATRVPHRIRAMVPARLRGRVRRALFGPRDGRP